MLSCFIIHILSCYLMALLSMAFFTLLERKLLGYFQLRKGPNKVGVLGLGQPFADALKLFSKEHSKPSLSLWGPFMCAPVFGLGLALLTWSLYPHSSPSSFFFFGILFFLCVSSMNVYSVLMAGWMSNSKYSLLGSLRGVAQTISYEVSMTLILISVLIFLNTYCLSEMTLLQWMPKGVLCLPVMVIWFISMLAETNRTPFDFAEGESELVSGFNTEYSGNLFALIFMAEYTNILGVSFVTSSLFMMSSGMGTWLVDMQLIFWTLFFSILFIWVRATFPRMRYDRLMSLAWISILPFALSLLFFFIFFFFI
uniref:NADH dehydrogenase subunit 1 n=1 Tax=Antonbruunia milenae TaxID=3053535 RepID=UPI0030DE3166